MIEIKLGECPAIEGMRDAVHVAIITLRAGEDLEPGQRVEVDGATVMACKSYWKCVGIVDPFLNCSIVAKGALVNVVLLPCSVTSMRHHWSSDAFPVAAESGTTREESERWLRDFIECKHLPSLEHLVSAALGEHYASGVDDDDYETLYIDGEDACGSIPDEFWDHVENLTGKKCPRRATSFSCSC